MDIIALMMISQKCILGCCCCCLLSLASSSSSSSFLGCRKWEKRVILRLGPPRVDLFGRPSYPPSPFRGYKIGGGEWYPAFWYYYYYYGSTHTFVRAFCSDCTVWYCEEKNEILSALNKWKSWVFSFSWYSENVLCKILALQCTRVAFP